LYWHAHLPFQNQLGPKSVCEFDWDPAKAAGNERKHNVGFGLATTIFRDPLAMSIIDHYHNMSEERWITIGMAEDGQTLVVSHTYIESDQNNMSVRIISARKATRKEQRQYESSQ